MNQLPSHLFQIIQAYLPNHDYQTLLAASKDFYHIIGFETRIYSLIIQNEADFLKFWPEIQLKINKLIKFPQFQLDILCKEVKNRYDILSVLSPSSTSSSSSPTPPSSSTPTAEQEQWSRRRNVSCHFTGPIPLYFILQLKPSLLKLSADYFTKELPFLEDLQSLSLRDYGNLIHVSSLSHLQSIEFIDCPNLKDISCLQQVNNLKLIHCPGIIDVNTLGQIPSLTLIDCQGISDISGLQNNKSIKILDCFNIPHYFNSFSMSQKISLGFQQPESSSSSSRRLPSSASLLEMGHYQAAQFLSFSHGSGNKVLPPKNLKEISLADCIELKDLTSLTHLRKITLMNCPSLECVHGLERVPILSFISCNRLQDISGLGKNYKVILSHCIALENFTPLNSIPTVIIIHCPKFIQGEAIANVNHLEIHSCSQFKDVQSLGKVKSLSLIDCPNITSLKGLMNIPSIHIAKCSNLKSLKGLGNNEKILLYKSDGYHLKDPLLTRHSLYQHLSSSAGKDPEEICYLRKNSHLILRVLKNNNNERNDAIQLNSVEIDIPANFKGPSCWFLPFCR